MERKKKVLGFTLIEILTAMTILAVAMLSFVPMVISTIRANSFGVKMTRAATLAQDKLEEIKRMTFDDPEITDTNYPLSSPTETFDTIFNRYHTVSVGSDPDIKTVSVVVDWVAPGMPAQNTTYLTTKVRY